MDVFREFLESSTIHGLVYISTARAFLVKCFWFLVVAFGFTASVYLIYESFVDWSDSPIGTSEETLPISDVTFPKITVCPPKGTHTALNQMLKKHDGKSLENDKKEMLKTHALKLIEERESWEIMMDNLQYREKNRFRNWYEGKSEVSFQFEHVQAPISIMETIDYGNTYDPEYHYGQNFRTKISAVEGSVETPWFGLEFDEETFFPAFTTRLVSSH